MTGLTNAGTATAVLLRLAAERPSKQAVLLVADPDDPAATTALTYAELDTKARRIAGWLTERYQPGERVLLLHPMGLEFVSAFFGCLYAGMIAVPAPLPGRYRHERRRVHRIAEDAGVVAAFTVAGSLATVQEWAAEEGLAGLTVADSETLCGQWPLAEITTDTVALLQYTSGSTGDPKGVMISHANLLANVDSLARTFGFDENVRTGGWIPLYHDMGLMGQLLPALFLGSTCVLMNPMSFLKRPVNWLTMIDRYDIAWSAAPNFAYEHCCRRIDDSAVDSLDLSRWRYAANGSEPVRAATLTAFAKKFAGAGFREDAIAPCFGMAEATVFVSGGGVRPAPVRKIDAESLEQHEIRPAQENRPARSIVSCGIPRDIDVRAVDPETGEPMPDGQVGELWLRGRSVSRGYWARPDVTEAIFGAYTTTGDGPYLRTGDLGVLLDGELYVTGRIKEMVTSNGRNLYPQDIEYELATQHERLGGHVGAVFTVPVSEGDNETEALVVLHEMKGRASEDELTRLSAQMKQTVVREFGVSADGIVLLRPGSVRRTTSGKIQRTAMRELFLAEELSPVFADAGSQAVLAGATKGRSA
nr:MlcG [uncultured bacterium]